MAPNTLNSAEPGTGHSTAEVTSFIKLSPIRLVDRFSEHNFRADSKHAVKLMIGLVGTMAATWLSELAAFIRQLARTARSVTHVPLRTVLPPQIPRSR